MVVFPAISTLISLICAGVIARDAIAKPRPDKIAWAIAFGIFAIAAGTEVLGSLTEWTPALARVYYLTGAVLVVGYLALGELYLLAGSKIHRVAPGAMLLISAIAATLVLDAPVDEAKLAGDGWEALERGPALVAMAIGINSLGTLVLVGGLVYSAWRFKQRGIQRNRMIGCLLIAVGTIAVGMGGTLTRLGHYEFLYIAMSIGVAIIFAGVLATRRPDTTRAIATPQPEQAADARSPIVSDAITVNGTKATSNGHHTRPISIANPELAFIESRLATLDESALAAICREWSVERQSIDALDRAQARRAWALRSALTADSQARFDALPVAIRLQLTELYHDVMNAMV